MDWERFTNDQLDEFLAVVERKEAEGRALKIEVLEELDRRQVFTADGSRNLSEWYAARADVGSDTAKKLVRTMRRTVDKPWLREALGSGEVSFDRAEALSRIPDNTDTLGHLDIGQVRRVAADHTRLSTEDEARSVEDRFLVMQPSIDESWWKIWGGLDGVTGAVVDSALTAKADKLPDLPDGSQGSAAWRRATALYELASGGPSPKAHITMFVDAETATPTSGEAGVRLLAGPKVGQQALGAVLCDSVTEVTVNTADGVPMRYGRSVRATPPALHRAVLATTGGYCAADGCDSRYRVEAHHLVPYSQGGTTDPENLIPLCWFHHHIVIHERGFELYKHPDHGRIRFRKPPQSEASGRRPQG